MEQIIFAVIGINDKSLILEKKSGTWEIPLTHCKEGIPELLRERKHQGWPELAYAQFDRAKDDTLQFRMLWL